jgi:hypothetical protein
MHHRSSTLRWFHLAVPLSVLCACAPPRYVNYSHPSYHAAEYSADLTRCRNQSVTGVVVITQDNNVLSGNGVDEVRTNACMATQGWQEAPPSVSGIILM